MQLMDSRATLAVAVHSKRGGGAAHLRAQPQPQRTRLAGKWANPRWSATASADEAAGTWGAACPCTATPPHPLQVPIVSLAAPEAEAAEVLRLACTEHGFFYRELLQRNNKWGSGLCRCFLNTCLRSRRSSCMQRVLHAPLGWPPPLPPARSASHQSPTMVCLRSWCRRRLRRNVRSSPGLSKRRCGSKPTSTIGGWVGGLVGGWGQRVGGLHRPARGILTAAPGWGQRVHGLHRPARGILTAAPG